MWLSTKTAGRFHYNFLLNCSVEHRILGASLHQGCFYARSYLPVLWVTLCPLFVSVCLSLVTWHAGWHPTPDRESSTASLIKTHAWAHTEWLMFSVAFPCLLLSEGRHNISWVQRSGALSEDYIPHTIKDLSYAPYPPKFPWVMAIYCTSIHPSRNLLDYPSNTQLPVRTFYPLVSYVLKN